MIDQVDNLLIAWAESHAAAAVLGPPMSTSQTLTAAIHLLELQNEPVPRNSANELRLQLILRYLVTTSGPDVEAAHGLLWNLAISASARSRVDGWQIEFSPMESSMWSALNVPPQPCFLVGVPVFHEWEQPELPRVTKPPELVAAAGVMLEGVVMGPRSTPIAGARMELPLLRLSTQTDANGRFQFASVPGGDHFPSEMIVTARRRHQVVKLNAGQQGKPLTIKFKL